MSQPSPPCTVHTKLVNIKFSITSLETPRVILTKFPVVTDQKLVSEGKAWVTFAESLFRCSHWGSTRQYGTSSPPDCRTLFRLSFDILIWQLSNHNYILSPWMVGLWNDPSWKFALPPQGNGQPANVSWHAAVALASHTRIITNQTFTHLPPIDMHSLPFTMLLFVKIEHYKRELEHLNHN